MHDHSGEAHGPAEATAGRCGFETYSLCDNMGRQDPLILMACWETRPNSGEEPKGKLQGGEEPEGDRTGRGSTIASKGQRRAND